VAEITDAMKGKRGPRKNKTEKKYFCFLKSCDNLATCSCLICNGNKHFCTNHMDHKSHSKRGATKKRLFKERSVVEQQDNVDPIQVRKAAVEEITTKNVNGKCNITFFYANILYIITNNF